MKDFWDRVSKIHKGCWLWTGSVNKKTGYGLLCKKRIRTAHRLSWELHNGTIPGGLCVLHRCDVRTCVNPKHLFLGTKKDNTQDAVQKGRTCRGERIHNSKLTEAIVRKIRKSTKTQRETGLEFGTTQTMVSRIKSRRTWSHVT